MDAAPQTEMCDSLIKWFQTLQLPAPHTTPVELSDGVAMAQALHQLAPDTFTVSWLAKIKFEVGSNWRLKVSNLKKVCAGAMEYYADCLQLQLTQFRPAPDLLAIAEKHDAAELGVLLQLVLGCAVNCPDKEDYITQIMGLEESLQRNIMTALQQLENVWQAANTSPAATSLAGGVGGASAAIQSRQTSTAGGGGTAPAERRPLDIGGADLQRLPAAERADVLAQRCHEAERRVALLLDEKSTLQQEVAKVQEELDIRMAGGGQLQQQNVAIGDDGVSLGPVQPGSTRYTELRRQLDSMKDELLMAETQRDDFKIRCVQQEKDIAVLKSRVDELNKTGEELTAVKDEVDVLRESADRLKVCEAQLVTFKKKLEEYNDLRRQVKLLEERSSDYLQQTVAQEEQIKKAAALKGQVELYKKEIEELHGKLDAEMMKSVKTEFELSNLNARCTALAREKDNLLNEREQLRELCDELKCTQSSSSAMRTDVGIELSSSERTAGDHRQTLERLGADTETDHKAFLAQFMDESNQRIEKLRDQLKTANQRILYFEAQATTATSLEKSKETPDATILQQLKLALEQNERKASQLDEAHANITQHQSKIGQLEATLAVREQELSTADAKYRKSVDKIKEIIQCCDPKSTDYALSDKMAGLDVSDTNDNNEDGGVDVPAPRPPMDSVEERLMATAYYRLSTACHRDAMESRLALLNGAGQSFLNRQRQPAARKAPSGNTVQAFKK